MKDFESETRRCVCVFSMLFNLYVDMPEQSFKITVINKSEFSIYPGGRCWIFLLFAGKDVITEKVLKYCHPIRHLKDFYRRKCSVCEEDTPVALYCRDYS